MFLITISKINKWGQQGNMSKLIDALNNEDEEIRKASALTLGRLGDRSILEYLDKALKVETNSFVRMDIESSIKLIKSKKFIEGKPIFSEVGSSSQLQPVMNFSAKLGS